MRVNNYKHSPIQWHHNYFQVQSVVGKVDDHSEHAIRKRKKKAHHGAILLRIESAPLSEDEDEEDVLLFRDISNI